MRKFIVFLFLGIVGWNWIGSIPPKLFSSEDPIVKQKLIEKFIDLTKEKIPHCEGAYITFIEDKETKGIEIVVKCNKWSI